MSYVGSEVKLDITLQNVIVLYVTKRNVRLEESSYVTLADLLMFQFFCCHSIFSIYDFSVYQIISFLFFPDRMEVSIFV